MICVILFSLIPIISHTLAHRWYLHGAVNYNYSDRPNEWDTE